MQRPLIRKALALTGALLALAALTASTASCDEKPKPQTSQTESQMRDEVYEYLAENFPISEADYSNDRVNIDFWVDTWATAEVSEGKLTFVYLMGMNGDLIGYFVLDGLPTAKCKMGTPPYDFENVDGGQYNYDVQVPAPGLTGTYSTGAGECGTYFGRDALTGAYIEWTAISQLVYDQPLGLPEGVEPPALSQTTVEDVS